MAGSIILPIVSVFQGKGIKDATDELGKFGGVVGGVKKLLGGLGAVSIAKGAFDFIKDSVIKARDYERELNALKTIFGSSAPVMEKFAKDSAKIGLTTAQSAKASVFLGSVLKQSGFEMGKVTDETKRLVGLASDLATVYGYDVSEALSGMTALFRGEYDPIEKFGVAMKQAEVNALLLERGQKSLTGAMLREAQAQARLDLLYQRSADSQGAFARGQGTLFVEQRNLSVAYENFQAVIAQGLIPVLADMMALIGDFVTRNGPLFTKVFEGFGQVVQAVFTELNSSQGVLDEMVNLFINLTQTISFFAQIIIQHTASILMLYGSYVAVTTAMKIWAVLAPIVTALTYATEGAVLAVGYAFDILKIKAALATAGLTLMLGLIAISAQSLIDFARKFDEINAQLDEFGRKRANFNEEGQLVSEKDLADMERELKFLKQINTEYSTRAALRGKAHAAIKARAAAAAKESKDAAEALAKEARAFKATFQDILLSALPGSLVTRQLGKLESSVKTTFEGIFNKISEGVSKKLITGKAATSLRLYANNVKTELMQIASQRDKLASKLDLGKTLIADTKKAVKDFASLSSIMLATGESVTKSVSFMVGAFKVTTTETVQSVANAGTIINKFKDIVGKTKEFKASLEKLRTMGLSGDLYTQILGLGLDQGGAMAKSILEGGAGAVTTLNKLQEEIATLGGQMGESAAQVMYGAGINLTDGLVEGILAADESLKKAAETLAATFKNAFYGGINASGVTSFFNRPNVDSQFAENAIAEALKKSKVVDTSGLVTPGSAYDLNTGDFQSTSPQSVTINVSTGIVTDPIAVGKTIVEYINRYTKASGTITGLI